MKKVVYSPDATQKLRNIKHDITMKFGTDIAKRVLSNITQTLRKLQQFEKSGVSVERTMGVPCDYYMIYIAHNYVFYRIAEDTINIVDIFQEREDFMWKLFGIRTTSQETEEYWNE